MTDQQFSVAELDIISEALEALVKKGPRPTYAALELFNRVEGMLKQTATKDRWSHIRNNRMATGTGAA